MCNEHIRTHVRTFQRKIVRKVVAMLFAKAHELSTLCDILKSINLHNKSRNAFILFTVDSSTAVKKGTKTIATIITDLKQFSMCLVRLTFHSVEKAIEQKYRRRERRKKQYINTQKIESTKIKHNY